MTDTLEALVAEIEAGLEGVTAGPWAAYMDDFTVRVDDRFIPAQRNEPVALGPRAREALRAEIERRSLPFVELASGAGHRL